MSSSEPIQPKPAVSVWHSAFPQPKAQAEAISVDDLRLLILDSTKVPGKDYMVVDARRADFQTAFIKGAINLPAHSFYSTLPTIRPLLSICPLVIFHCNSCKPGGRGPRVAGWFLDSLAAAGAVKGSDDDDHRQVQVRFLEGWKKSWFDKFGTQEELAVQLPPLD